MKNIMPFPKEFPITVFLGDERIQINNSTEFCAYLDRCAEKERVNGQPAPARLRAVEPTHSSTK